MGIKERLIKPKKRGVKTRTRKPVILIATEGNNKTESVYFSNFKSMIGCTIKFCKGNDTDPVSMIEVLGKEIKRESITEKNDRAFCVFDTDTDTSKNAKIIESKQRIRNSNISIITSNPCFEIWFLNHFVYSTKLYNSNDEVINELKKYITNYDKTKDVYKAICGGTNIAIENAKKQEKHHLELGHTSQTIECNPSTEVYNVVEEILRYK